MTATLEQEIIEVSQDEVKKALKALLVKQNDFIAMLYAKHEEYNQQYFNGQLSIPLITIERMDNRTLANYTFSGNNIPVDNHIRFNRNFVALNTPERILETLRHEMIHQYQDEVLYMRDGQKEPKEIIKPVLKEGGDIGFEKTTQKRRPKEPHNSDFKELAEVVGIPAIGPKCHGNPVKMPQAKSYNRKYRCHCRASNGYYVTIWSTRQIEAVCMVCKQPFQEVTKVRPSATVEVKQSHVERPGEDAIEKTMLQKYPSFIRAKNKKELEDKLAEVQKGHTLQAVDVGVYQKGHNAYKDGFRYWAAYKAELKAEEEPKPEDKQPEDKQPEDKQPEDKQPEDKQPEGKQPKSQKPEKPKPAQKAPKATPKTEPKVVRLKAKTEGPKMTKNKPLNAKTLIEAYQQAGSVVKAAKALEITPDAFLKAVKDMNIDLGSGKVKGD